MDENARFANYKDYTGIEDGLRGSVKRVRRGVVSYRTNFICRRIKKQGIWQGEAKTRARREEAGGQEQTGGWRISEVIQSFKAKIQVYRPGGPRYVPTCRRNEQASFGHHLLV